MMNLIVNFSTRGLALLLGLPLLLAVTSCEQDEPRPGQDETPGQKVRKEGGSDEIFENGENVSLYAERDDSAAIALSTFDNNYSNLDESWKKRADTALWLLEGYANRHMIESTAADTNKYIREINYDTIATSVNVAESADGPLVNGDDLQSLYDYFSDQATSSERTLLSIDFRMTGYANGSITVNGIVSNAKLSTGIITDFCCDYTSGSCNFNLFRATSYYDMNTDCNKSNPSTTTPANQSLGMALRECRGLDIIHNNHPNTYFQVHQVDPLLHKDCGSIWVSYQDPICLSPSDMQSYLNTYDNLITADANVSCMKQKFNVGAKDIALYAAVNAGECLGVGCNSATRTHILKATYARLVDPAPGGGGGGGSD